MAEIELLGIDVLLRIDGHVRSLTDVEALFQHDPYPGGHRFFLKLEGPTAERIFPDLALGRFQPPAEDQVRRALSSLQIFLQRLPREGVVMFLNTVDDMLLERGRVHLSGVCSPIIPRRLI